jgi:glycosyltransferase involved in cell wall biosynthesis
MARILLVTNIFPPIIGGPATFADRLATRLAERGHSVRVLCSSNAATDPGDQSRRFRVLRVSMANRYLYEVMVRLKLLREFLIHRRILVIGLEPYVLDVARLLRRRYMLRLPGDTVWESAKHYGLYAGTHADFLAAPQAGLIEGLAAKRRGYMALASVIITPSRYLGTLASRWLPGGPPVRVIENGAAVAAQAPLARKRSSSQLPLKALFVGRLINSKGVETLLLAARDLTGIAFEICGDGPEWPMLTGLHRQLGAPVHITFCGKVSVETVQQKMAEADIFIQISEMEGMSNSLLEACAAGIAPIVSDIPSNREVVTDDESALVVPYGDPARLRAALERLRDDPALRTRLAKGARAAADRLPFEKTVEAYIALIEESA